MVITVGRLQPATEHRSESRLHVTLPAVVTTCDGTRRVVLEDLSAGGARLRGDLPRRPGEQALLQWARFEALGVVWWSDDGDCGIRFLDPVPAADLLATRDLADQALLPTERDLVRRTAAAFVNGRMRL